MTVGNNVVDGRVNVTYTLDSGSTGSFLSGKYVTKSWSGGDGLKAVAPNRGILRKYTTLDRRNGRIITRYFRERAPARARSSEPHPYTMSLFKFEAKPWTYSVKQYTYPGGTFLNQQTVYNLGHPVATPLLPTLPSWDSNDDITLINQLKEKSRGSDFNATIALSQGNQALRMIGDSAIRIARALRLVKRGNLIGAVHEMSKSAKQTAELRRRLEPLGLWRTRIRQRASNQLSSNWLELQYGWMPLLQDIHGGAKLLADKLNVPFRARVVARKSVRNPKPISDASPYGAGQAYAIYSKQIVAYFSEPESIPKLLGLKDPASVAWEVFPFSFVLDWIYPIGDFLEARGYASDLVGTFVSTTFTRQLWHGVAGRAFFNEGTGVSGVTVVTGGSYYCEKVDVNRSISYALSVPAPSWKGLAKAASWQHCVNGLALLTQVIKRR